MQNSKAIRIFRFQFTDLFILTAFAAQPIYPNTAQHAAVLYYISHHCSISHSTVLYSSPLFHITILHYAFELCIMFFSILIIPLSTVISHSTALYPQHSIISHCTVPKVSSPAMMANTNQLHQYLSIIPHSTISYLTVLYYIHQYWIMLQHCIIPHSTVLYLTVLYCIHQHCIIFQCCLIFLKSVLCSLVIYRQTVIC